MKYEESVYCSVNFHSPLALENQRFITHGDSLGIISLIYQKLQYYKELTSSITSSTK